MGTRRLVLLVDDDRELRETVQDALTAAGHVVIATAHGREALAAMRTQRPDVVVFDLLMPVMEGWQFRLEQKRDPDLADTPVIAMSATTSAAGAVIDADAYISKPVDLPTLVQTIEAVVQSHERRREVAEQSRTERLAALGVLAAGLAHEINNPLTCILLQLDEVVRVVDRLDDGALLQALQMLVDDVRDGAVRIRDVIASVLTVARGGNEPETLIDVRAILDSALTLVSGLVRNRARIVRDYRDCPHVVGGAARLGQVFANLLINAAQAMPEGRTEANELRITARSHERGASVEISDRGGGIPEALIGRIFEPFFTTKPVGEGSGLGLSVSYRIVKSLGGDILVSSTLGSGTTFQVLLPTRPARSAEGPTPASPPLTSRRRILIVDDEPELRRVLQKLLGQRHDVEVAPGGTEALALLEAGTTSTSSSATCTCRACQAWSCTIASAQGRQTTLTASSS